MNTMARITKKGLLSGGVGDLVYVTNTEFPYARQKPADVKQTERTKKAARNFGWVSGQDRKYREQLKRQLNLVTSNRYAAKHRGRMEKALSGIATSNMEEDGQNLGQPAALTGYNFNAHLLWQEATRIYPEFTISGREMQCSLPSLKARREIVFPKGANTAQLRLDAFTVNPTLPQVKVNLLSTYTVEVSGSKVFPPEVWKVDLPEEKAWLVVTGTVIFGTGTGVQTIPFQGSSVYLWARVIGE